MSKPFIHLHNHTEFSALDGLTRVDDLVGQAKKHGQPAIAITDHGMLAGAPDFYKAAKAADIVPILGEEFYIVRDASIQEKTKEIDTGNRHLLMHALNLKGWHLMVELTSVANTEAQFYRRPRLDHNVLKHYKKDLKHVAVTTACLSSEVARALQDHGEEQADEMLMLYRDLFPNLYLELQKHPIRKKFRKLRTPQAQAERDFDRLEKDYLRYLVRANERFDIPVVITGDSHFGFKEDADIHDFMLAMQTGNDYNDPDRWRFNGTGYWVQSTEEMKKLWAKYPRQWKQSLGVQQDILKKTKDLVVPEFETKTWHIPVIPGQEGDPVDILRKKCRRALKAKGLHKNQEYVDRLNHELSVIREANFEQIFLIVEDYVNWARDHGILVGPGRGSMVGTIVSYLLGITLIDPIEYRLLFERAINPARPSIPDFDIDFETGRVEEVIDYVREKYGADNVMLIGTHLHLAARATVKDVLRTLKVPFDMSNRITAQMPESAEIVNNKVDGDIDSIMGNLDVAEFNKVLKEYPIAGRAISKLHGTLKSHGRHAAGVVISDNTRSLRREVPQMYIPSSKTIASQYDMDGLKNLHLVKFDFLRLGTLNAIAQAKEFIGHDPFEKHTRFDDPQVFEMMKNGDLVTIFQFQGGAARQCIMEMGVDNFEDLVAVNALARPGAINFLPQYVASKRRPKSIKYACKEVRPILEYTYGVILYQEQVMEIVKELAGWDDLGADKIKEAIKSKSGTAFDEMKTDFLSGCKKNGISKSAAEEIWKNIDDYRSYGFNRAHAVAYSAIGYQTAYLKCHYPKEWLAAYLNTGQAEKNFEEVMDEIRRLGIPLFLPDINRSSARFTPNKKGIRFGILQIKGVGEASVTDILAERKKHGKFTSFEDFELRAQEYKFKNRGVMKALRQSGALNALTGERPSIQEEREYLGTWVTKHPLDRYRIAISDLINKRTNLKRLESREDEGNEVYWGGMVVRVKEITTKNSQKMAFVEVSFYGRVYSFTLFPNVWVRYSSKIYKEAILVGRGKWQPERNAILINTLRIIA